MILYPARRRSASILALQLESQLPFSSIPSRTSPLPPSLTHSHSASSRLGDSENPRTAFALFSRALKLSAKSGICNLVKQVHAHTFKFGFFHPLSLQNQILNAYVKCKEFNIADRLFDEMPERNVVTFNILICGIVDCRTVRHRIHLGFSYFKRLLLTEVSWDHITFNALIRASTELNDIKPGWQLHCCAVKEGLNLDCFISSALVDFYGKCGLVISAGQVFDEVPYKDLVLWNTMISSYVSNRLIDEAYKLFMLMGSYGLKGDAFTFSSLLSSCGGELGKQIHGLVVKLSFELDIPVATSLVDMYAKINEIKDARKCFDEMADLNVVSWNAMIVGYGRHGDGKETMRLLLKMLKEHFNPDELTFASILSSCGNISAVGEILQTQAFVVKRGLEASSSVVNGLINAYSNCGDIAKAVQCFNSHKHPDLVSWTSVVSALAFHGFASESIEMFEKLLKNVSPDRIAFLEVLSACSHGGLVPEGLRYFKMMIDVYKIEPDSEHYTCLIDILGRAGFLTEAFDVLKCIPKEPRSDALGAFFGACQVHENGELAKLAAEKLVAIEPNNPVNYSLLSNVYTSEGRWNDAADTRKAMEKICVHKIPGRSWVENLL